MRVGADDKMDSLCLLREFNILLVTNVRERDDALDVAVLLLDHVDGALGGLDGVLEGGSLAGVGKSLGGLGGDRNNRSLCFL